MKRANSRPQGVHVRKRLARHGSVIVEPRAVPEPQHGDPPPISGKDIGSGAWLPKVAAEHVNFSRNCGSHGRPLGRHQSKWAQRAADQRSRRSCSRRWRLLARKLKWTWTFAPFFVVRSMRTRQSGVRRCAAPVATLTCASSRIVLRWVPLIHMFFVGHTARDVESGAASSWSWDLAARMCHVPMPTERRCHKSYRRHRLQVVLPRLFML